MICLDTIYSVAEKFVGRLISGEFDPKLDSTLSAANGITGLFSYPPSQIETVIQAMRNANEDFRTMPKNYYDPHCGRECQYGFTGLEFTTVFGVTVGGSKVGFCTPDTNTFQLQRTRTGTKKSGVPAVFGGDSIEWEPAEWTVTIALGIYVAGAVSFKPKSAGATLSAQQRAQVA